MAYMRSNSGKKAPSGGRVPPQRGIRKLVPWVAIPGIGMAFAVWSLTIVSDLYSINQPAASTHGAKPFAALASLGPTGAAAPFGAVAFDRAAEHGDLERRARVGHLAKDAARSARLSATAKTGEATGRTAVQKRFDTVAAKAALTPQKLALLFGEPEEVFAEADIDATPAKTAKKTKPVIAARQAAKAAVASLAPGAARFGAEARDPSLARFGANDMAALSGTVLAYADPKQGHASDALASLLVTPDEDEATQESALPDYEVTPDFIPLPRSRPMPHKERAAKQDSAPAEADDQDARKPASRGAEIERRQPPPAKQAKRAAQNNQRLAYASPEESTGGGRGLGQTFRNLFGGNGGSSSRPRAGGGVAVYDISAAKVYMPDGSVLEAHSGIGHMADNPRYADKRMNGPTPPHTYNLRMRESRFHGVEAVRMIPVDGKNKYGRTGILAHSYLLRGRRAQSHGCVAFANYDKFLKAFKQGKVKQIVVVPGGGKATATRIASNGRST